MARRFFPDPDELASLLRACDADIWIRGPSRHPSSIDIVNVGDIELQSIHLTPALTAALRMRHDLVRVSIPVARQGDWTIHGRPYDVGNVLLAGPGGDYVAATEGAVRFTVVYIPQQLFLESYYALCGEEPPFAMPCAVFTPDPQALRAAQWMIYTLHSFASHFPQLAQEPALNRAVLGRLLEALAGIIDPKFSTAHPPMPVPGHIVRQLEEFMHAHETEPLCVTDLCSVASASERTIRNVFNKVYGMSPARYLRLRRLNQARRALRDHAGAEVRVTDVAVRYGFLDVGRFAAEYRHMFGEYPSQTLRRA
jgi:AraC family ethanolamine operon transcriptional activator